MLTKEPYKRVTSRISHHVPLPALMLPKCTFLYLRNLDVYVDHVRQDGEAADRSSSSPICAAQRPYFARYIKD